MSKKYLSVEFGHTDTPVHINSVVKEIGDSINRAYNGFPSAMKPVVVYTEDENPSLPMTLNATTSVKTGVGEKLTKEDILAVSKTLDKFSQTVCAGDYRFPGNTYECIKDQLSSGFALTSDDVFDRGFKLALDDYMALRGYSFLNMQVAQTILGRDRNVMTELIRNKIYGTSPKAGYKAWLNAMWGYNAFASTIDEKPKVKFKKENEKMPKIKNVIFNDPAVIVMWADGTKTVSKATGDDIFNPEVGLAMAIAKKVTGNYETFVSYLPKKPEKIEDKKLKRWIVHYTIPGTGDGHEAVDAYTEKAAGNIVKMNVARSIKRPLDMIYILCVDEIKDEHDSSECHSEDIGELRCGYYDVEMIHHYGPNLYLSDRITKRVCATSDDDAKKCAVSWAKGEYASMLGEFTVEKVTKVDVKVGDLGNLGDDLK